MLFDRNATIDAFRAAVLNALDKTAAELFNEPQGATDSDLPSLFRAIDAQTENLARRFGITWE
jgi:hypothetical protein